MELLEREAALGALEGAFEQAVAGRGRVVLVTGAAGIGKTSLAAGFADRERPGRVLWGICDDLHIPRPLGPLRDLVGVSEELTIAVESGAAPVDVHRFVLDELASVPRPTVLVLEDVHWADEATLDLIAVVGRRIADLPALVVLTFREGEMSADHPLRARIGSLPPHATVHLGLEPLTVGAVAAMAGSDEQEIYAVTGGNPFFVTELLASRPEKLPPSVALAVVSRVARLEETSRRLLELVSVVPGRVDTALLDRVMPGWPQAAEEPERRDLLVVRPRSVAFRHELARTAVAASLPVARRRLLSGQVLDVFVEGDADPADIVHHAEAAGATEVVARYALVAARSARDASANTQAWSHYMRAMDFAASMSPGDRAALFEEAAWAAYTVNRTAEALEIIDRALTLHRTLGDTVSQGRCHRVLSRLHWYAGDGEAARREGHVAVDLLEPLGESADLAMAYSNLSQLAMLAGDHAETVRWGRPAEEMAVRLGVDTIRAHALVSIGTSEADLDPDDTATLLRAHALAVAVGEHHEAVRALLTLHCSQVYWARPAAAEEYAQQAIAYADRNEVSHLLSYTKAHLGWLRLLGGDWAEAERLTAGELAADRNVSHLLASTVLAILAVRRGDDDATARLEQVRRQAERSGDLLRTLPVLVAEVEWAVLAERPVPEDRIAAAASRLAEIRPRAGWPAGQLAAAAALAGVEIRVEEPMALPYEAMARREWRRAADAWDAVGWNFEQALCLSMLDDEGALSQAVEIARGMGARPLADHVARRMRLLGLTVPSGPRDTTRRNPAGLTDRQIHVLRLVADGLTNAEIADVLYVSPRTVDHHVSAVLAKLEVPTRRDATRRARELGLV